MNTAASEDKRTVRLPHNIIMENRKKIMLTGVARVDSFDEDSVVLLTDMGELTIRGKNLHISQLNVDTGELNVTGSILGLVYNDDDKRAPLLKRLFR